MASSNPVPPPPQSTSDMDPNTEVALSDEQLAIRAVATDLAISNVLQTDWSLTLCAAPSAITILGECAILSSVPSASSVRMDFGDLGSATLPAKLFECNQMGRTTFVEAQARMAKISMYAANVAPTVDRIVDLFERRETPVTRKFLDIQIRLLQKAAQTSADEAEEILRYFDSWKEATAELALAISGQKDLAILQGKEKTKELRKNKAQTLVAKDNVDKAQKLLDMQQTYLNEALRQRDLTMAGAQLAFEFGAAAAMPAPVVALGGIAIANAGVVMAQASVNKARELSHKQSNRVEEAEAESKRLVADLKKLQDEESSLDAIKEVLLRGMSRMLDLQQNVQSLLLFFRGINDQVQNMVDFYSNPFLASLEFGSTISEDERDDVYRDMIRTTALDVKVRFVIMQKLSQVYAEVSEKHIISGFRTVDSLSLLETSLSDADVRLRHKDLENYRVTATEGISGVTEHRKKEMMDNLLKMVEHNAQGTTLKKIKSS